VDDKALEGILDCGRRYRTTMLLPYWIPEKLACDWRPAFDFFLGHACYQGRRDDVSQKVDDATREVLAASLYAAPDWSDPQFTEFRSLLEERVGAGVGKAGKARDVEMVISALRFVTQLPDHNLVAYSIGQLRAGELAAHYVDLQAARSPDGIVQVGPKIAAFYLRDLVSLFALDGCVTAEEFGLLQPVDVWVRRLVARLGLAAEAASEETIRASIIDVCNAHGYSPLLFNQGLWYLGTHALDLLLECLGVPPATT
jgi:hypothetical protein